MEEHKLAENERVEKFDIKIKSKPKNGVILQLHHTVRGSHGECRRIRFATGIFDDTQEKLACADNGGNLFILHFSNLKFWKLSSCDSCTALHFVPNKLDSLIVAKAKKFDLNFMDIETGKVYLTLTGHTSHIKHISFSKSKINNLLTASHAEAILWELNNNTKYFTLNTYLGAQIQQIMFTPASDYLVACFQNDTVQIWRHDTMKSVKQIIPGELKHLKSIAFTMNGRAMAMAGLVPTLILFSMDTWTPIKSIDLTKYSIKGVHQIAFLPQIFDGGANKILAMLSSDCTLYMMDLETLKIIHTIHPETSGIKKFVVSPTGKYFLCILQLGEVNIYKSCFILDKINSTVESSIREVPGTSTKTYQFTTQCNSPTKAEVEQKMRVCMDSARLRRILMQYGEYPDKFRSVIWRSLLNTPKNKLAYSSLIDKGIHPAYRDIEKQFTFHSSITLKNLKRLLSCLAHWCPLFGIMKFLPAFVFPFVKVLQKDPLLLFECVATILINHCQLWFEYAPFPPISILAMIENVLAEHDQQLLDHYCEVGVTSQIYALKILETAFSEVLTCSEWLILWDHILSNEPAFVLMTVVSYNIVQKNAIRKLKGHQQIERFFHKQNPIDKKLFLKKAYILLNETSDETHPRKFFKSFESLEKGNCYQPFLGYPKATICLKLAKKEREKKVRTCPYTLRELIKQTQEKEINERLRVESDQESEVKEYYAKDKYFKKQRRKCDGHSHNKGDNKNNVKEELLKSVLYSELHLQEEKEILESNSKRNKDKIRDTPRNKTKKKSPKKYYILEKEVERLMRSCTTSDTSD